MPYTTLQPFYLLFDYFFESNIKRPLWKLAEAYVLRLQGRITYGCRGVCITVAGAYYLRLQGRITYGCRGVCITVARRLHGATRIV